MERPSIEGYELGDPIGKGGVGTVYAARRASTGTRAAVKVLDRAIVPDRQRSAMFLNEALAASAIKHPSIVDIIDVGELGDGRPYLVRELVAGESLAERLRRVRRLPPADVIDFAGQVAGALGAAHDEGIVHGAISPETLSLMADLSLPRGERVKVIDFGMCRLPVPVGADDRAPYLAPEQRAESPVEVDHRADVYALGAVMYRALCGAPPPVGEDELPALPGDLPPHLEAAILRALARRPEQRFDSMAVLATAVKGDGQLAWDRPPSRRPSRARLAVAALAVVAAAVLWSMRAPEAGALVARVRALVGF
jgi:eukaryotic-like serine/threonine-protein kinase